jgi:hypothetical protein
MPKAGDAFQASGYGKGDRRYQGRAARHPEGLVA